MNDFIELVDLASLRLGGAAVLANDEFFAPKENLLKSTSPAFIEGKYTERGKWMDGWETRRRRTPGHDWCIVRLGAAGVVHGIIVDTTHFKGNYPEACSLDGCAVSGTLAPTQIAENARWRELLPRSALNGDSVNLLAVAPGERVTHVRLNIFPDGGVARLRVHGLVAPDWDRLLARGGQIDLAAAENGGRVLSASDMFFGNRHNLIMPGRGTSMADGWETKRRRGPGYDWCIVQLGRAGSIDRIEIDTIHFKGNAPGSCSLEVCQATSQALDRAKWQELLPSTPLLPDTLHVFEQEVLGVAEATHARFNIFPDGGVSRLRLFGRIGK